MQKKQSYQMLKQSHRVAYSSVDLEPTASQNYNDGNASNINNTSSKRQFMDSFVHSSIDLGLTGTING